MDRFTSFAESVTGGDFESKNITVKGIDSPEVGAVFRTRNALLAEIEKQFKLHFC